MMIISLQRIHCGCIVSDNSFMLLDPGGIECNGCAREHLTLVGLSITARIFVFPSPYLFLFGATYWTLLSMKCPVGFLHPFLHCFWWNKVKKFSYLSWRQKKILLVLNQIFPSLLTVSLKDRKGILTSSFEMYATK